jgi:hypothetical protein
MSAAILTFPPRPSPAGDDSTAAALAAAFAAGAREAVEAERARFGAIMRAVTDVAYLGLAVHLATHTRCPPAQSTPRACRRPARRFWSSPARLRWPTIGSVAVVAMGCFFALAVIAAARPHHAPSAIRIFSAQNKSAEMCRAIGGVLLIIQGS